MLIYRHSMRLFRVLGRSQTPLVGRDWNCPQTGLSIDEHSDLSSIPSRRLGFVREASSHQALTLVISSTSGSTVGPTPLRGMNGIFLPCHDWPLICHFLASERTQSGEKPMGDDRVKCNVPLVVVDKSSKCRARGLDLWKSRCREKTRDLCVECVHYRHAVTRA